MTVAVPHRAVVVLESAKMSNTTIDRRQTSPITIQYGSKRGQKRFQRNTVHRNSASSDEGFSSPVKILPRGTDPLSLPTGIPNARSLASKRYSSNRTPPPKARVNVVTPNEKTTDYSSFNSASSSDEMKAEKNYAGASFNSPPEPTVLPKPPSHWMSSRNDSSVHPAELISNYYFHQTTNAMSMHLKGILKVPIQA